MCRAAPVAIPRRDGNKVPVTSTDVNAYLREIPDAISPPRNSAPGRDVLPAIALQEFEAFDNATRQERTYARRSRRSRLGCSAHPDDPAESVTSTGSLNAT
jgi:hypothetical protein